MFFEAHYDPAPARVMNELLPFFQKENVTTFYAEQPITETKESTIQSYLLVEQTIKLKDQNDPYVQQYYLTLPAYKEYINFLQNLSKYSIDFKAVDTPPASNTLEQISNRVMRNKFVVDNIIKSDVDKSLMLIGLHHYDIGCQLTALGYDVQGYYIPSLPVGKYEYSKIDDVLRPKNKDKQQDLWKVQMKCDKDYFFDLKVIDTSLNDQLNATHIIIDDYYN